MFIGNFELSAKNGWYVEKIDIKTKKDIRTKDIQIKHGIDYDDYAYFDGLEITISGKCKTDPIIKSHLLNIINYGMFYLKFDDGFYVVENSYVNFVQSVDIPDVEIFTFVFISPVPYKYNNDDIIKTSMKTELTTKKLLDNENIKMPIDDLNVMLDIAYSGTTVCTRNYRILSCENDDGSLEPVNENYLTKFDNYKNSISAVFNDKRYISRFYLYFDEITNYKLFKSDIEILYKNENNQFEEIKNDFTFKTIDAKCFGLRGKIYIFENINVETNILKIRYINPLGKGYFRYNYDFTRRNISLIIPDYNSFCYLINSGTYFMNPQKGIILYNGKKDIYSFIGQFLRIYPHVTYVYSDYEANISIKFNNYNFYEVEHV